MKNPLRIALLAILLVGGGQVVAIYFMTAADPPEPAGGAPRAEPVAPATRATSARAPAPVAPPSVGLVAPPSRPGASATVPLPRVLSAGRAGFELSAQPEARAQELAAIRSQRQQAMMGFLNRRGERAAAERAAAGAPGERPPSGSPEPPALEPAEPPAAEPAEPPATAP